MRKQNLIVIIIILFLCIGGISFFSFERKDKTTDIAENDQMSFEDKELEEAYKKLGEEEKKTNQEIYKQRQTPTRGGIELNYTEDFNEDSIGITIEEINKLPIYYMKVSDNEDAYYKEVGETFFGDCFSKVEIKKKKEAKNRWQGDYIEAVYNQDNISMKMSGSLYWLLFERKGIVPKEETETDILSQTEQLINQLKLGVWDGEDRLLSLQEQTKFSIYAFLNFENRPCAKGTYNHGKHGIFYVSDEGLGFEYDSSGNLKTAKHLFRASVSKKTALPKKYSSLDNILTEAKTKLEYSDYDKGIYVIYDISKIECVYALGYNYEMKDTSFHWIAVPMIELCGTKEAYWIQDNQWTKQEQQYVGINLYTEEVMIL